MQLLAQERLTAKQQAIIKHVYWMLDTVPITRLVKQLIGILECSETTVWNNMNQLKRIGILTYGDSKNKGIPVMITDVGEVVSKLILEDENGKTV